MDLIIFFLLGHFIGDYGLQTDKMATRKKHSVAVLSAHVLIYTITIGFSIGFFCMLEGFSNHPTPLLLGQLAVVLFVTHWIQDFSKCRLSPSRQLYYLDQSLHIILLVIFRYILLG